MLGFILPLLRWRTLIVLLGLAAVGVLVWYLGPLLHLFGTTPLADANTRTAVICAMFAAVFVVWGFRTWRARVANARMISKLMDSEGLASLTDAPGQGEVAILRERFEDTMKLLRSTRLGNAGSGLMLDLPWYVIIGPPGSGKTTILRNSGLDFPLAERVGGEVIAGMGGTRNCDWWLTDEAVILDTAGRYTTQDSNSALDQAAWRGFLNLLKEFRRRRPLNGVLLTISLADVLTRGTEERSEQIEIFRRRLQELMRAFGLRLPVYLLITKCDLLSGFSEFFDDLADDEREQVWGMAFTPEQADNSLSAAWTEGFTALLQRVLDRMPSRLHEERDSARRRLIYALPQQFGALRSLVGGFVNEVFRVNRYEMAPMLRGVFFTSGTQEGTPIDRLMSSFARAFGLPEAQAARPMAKGRTFFVRQLLTDVVFAESGLVGTDRKLERRLAVMHAAGYAAAVAVTGLLSLAWFSAYARSSADARTLSAQAAGLDAMQARTGSRTLGDDLPQLQQARALAGYYDDSGFLEGWVTRLGLSSQGTLAPRAQAVYRRLLTGELLPQLFGRIRSQLIAAASGEATNEQLHDLLAVYLMLGDPTHFDRAAVAAWMRADADAAFPLDPGRREALWANYQALLAQMPTRLPLDANLIDAVRQRLVRVPQVGAIYANLRQAAGRNPSLPAFSFSQAMGSAADTAFSLAGGTGLRTTVPGFFTRTGFYDGFVARLPGLVRDQMQTDWVLGQDANSPSVAAAQTLIRQVSDMYVRDYVAAWQMAIARIGLTRWTTFEGLQTVLQTLVGPNRPLERILDAVRSNTTLPRQRDAAAAPAPDQAGDPATRAANAVGRIAANVESSAAGLVFPDPWPGDQIRQPFLPLVALVDGQPPTVSRIEDEIGAVYAVINQIAANEDPSAAALRYESAEQRNQATSAAAVLRNDSATKPEPVRTIMLQVANSVAGTIAGGARQRVDTLWRSDVLPACQSVVGGRYPFVPGVKDEVTLKDFSDFFKPGGTMEQFAKSFAPTAGGGAPALIAAAAAAPPPTTAPLPPAVLAEIAGAARIRTEFFAASGTDPIVRFSLTPIDMDPRLASATIRIDNESLVFRHDPPHAMDFQWPTRVDSSEAKIVLRDFKSEATVADEKGAWALFRLLDDVGLQPTARPDTFTFTVTHDGLQASFRLTASSIANPFTFTALRSFHCVDSP